jgi:malate permease and related proteins
MQLFIPLLFKILPLYVLIFFGFIAGKLLHVQKESVARLLIYIITPFVVFNGTLRAHLTLSTLSLPLLFFCLSTISCIVFFYIAKYFYKGSEKNILAFAAGSGNVGYFGLPVAIAIFGDQVTPLVVLSILGFIVFENSVGFFVTARGEHTTRESILRVLRLPSIYAFMLGIVIQLFRVPLGEQYSTLAASFQGAYSVLGMMLIGLGVASFTRVSFDRVFIGIAFIAKFLCYPLLVLLIIALDSMFFQLYDAKTHSVMILLSIVPLAANTVAFATALKVHPEKAAMAVLLSTVFALVYIPFIVSLFQFH